MSIKPLRRSFICLVLILGFMQGCVTQSSGDCDQIGGGNSALLNCQESSVAVNVAPIRLGIKSYRPNYLIATDLINALTQIETYASTRAVLKMPKPTSDFMRAVQEVFVDRGYDIEFSNARTGRGVLMTSVIRSGDQSDEYTYLVAIDRVAMKRDYQVGVDRWVAPISSLFVRGVSPNRISLNDGLFVSQL